MFDSVLLVSAVVIGILLLGIPVFLRGMYRFSARCKVTRLATEQLPGDAANLLASRMQTLQALGFQFVDCCDFGVLTMETRTIVASFAQGQAQETANVWLSISADRTSSYLEFSTLTSRGISLETNSNGILPLAPENPEIRVFRFPEISEAAELHRIHRQIVAKYGDSAWIRPESASDEIERITRNVEGYGPRLCKLGYLRLAENGESYGLTWKGAFRVTGNGIWPVAAIRRTITRYEMRNELRSLQIHVVTRLQKA